MKKTRKILIGILAGAAVLGISASLISTYAKDNGVAYRLAEESIEGKIKELSKVLTTTAKQGEKLLVEDIELDLYPDESEFLMAGQVYDQGGDSKLRWNYFGSKSSGKIYEEKIAEDDHVIDTNGVSLETFVDIIQAAKLDELIAYGKDHVGILYFDGRTSFSKEERAKTYQYDNMEASLNEDGSIKQLGYYLYQDGICAPVEDMSGMDGEYECINISFSNQNEKKSYRAVARLGILIAHGGV